MKYYRRVSAAISHEHRIISLVAFGMTLPRHFQAQAHDSRHTIAVILYYEYVLTLPTEVRQYWQKGRWSLATVLFFLNRYVAIISHVPIVYEYFFQSSESVSVADAIFFWLSMTPLLTPILEVCDL